MLHIRELTYSQTHMNTQHRADIIWQQSNLLNVKAHARAYCEDDTVQRVSERAAGRDADTHGTHTRAHKNANDNLPMSVRERVV